MRLIRAEIDGFGQYRGRVIDFDQGINVYAGANESGKTTLLKFIEGVLYGFYLPVIPRRYSPDYEKYRPWDGGSYAGSLIYEENHQTISIFRDFAADVVRMTDVKTGKDLTGQLVYNGEIRQVDPASRDWKLSHSAFKNTICIAQGNAQPEIREINQELEQSLRNLMETGDQSLSIEKSMTSIQSRLREIEGDGDSKSSRIAAMEEEIQNLDRRIEQQQLLEKQKKRIQWELRELPEEVDDPEDAEQVCSQLGTQEQQEHLQSIQQEMDAVLQEKEQNDAGIAEKVPEQGEIVTEKSSAVFYKAGGGILAGTALILIFVLSPWAALGFPAGAVLFWYGMKLEQKAQMEARQQEYDSRMQTALSELSGKMTEQERERRLKRLQDQYDRWLCRYATAIVQKRLTELHAKLEEMHEENLEEMLEERRKISSEKDMLVLERDSLHAAAQAIELLSQDVRKEFTPILTRKIKDTVSNMTLGRYNTVYVSPDTGVQTLNSEGKEISLDRVSAGTGDQIYLALRLEMAELISPGVKLPVILDDAFARYDEQRLRNCLALLARKSSDTQILIFSCQMREKEMLQQMKVPFAFHPLSK